MKTLIKTLTVTMLTLLVLLAFTSCGGKEVTLNINDSGVETQTSAKTGQKIRDILAAAEIFLGDKDETDPAIDSKLTEDVKEILIKRYAKVTIVKDDNKTEVELTGETVEEALKKAGISLSDDEIVDKDLKAILKDGMIINVLKGIKVILTVDGKSEEMVVAEGTSVKELLKQEEIALGDDDVCTESMDTKLTDGMKISVKRVEYKEETKTETINFETKKEYSSSIGSGKTEVKQEGANGEKEVTYKVKYVDGEEAGKEVVSEKIIKEAVDKIIIYGTQSASGNSSSSGSSSSGGGKTIVSKTPVYDCDGSGHGYYEIVYSDGSKGYEEF